MKKVLTRWKLISLQCYLYMPNSMRIIFSINLQIKKKQTNKQTKQNKTKTRDTMYSYRFKIKCIKFEISKKKINQN